MISSFTSKTRAIGTFIPHLLLSPKLWGVSFLPPENSLPNGWSQRNSPTAHTSWDSPSSNAQVSPHKHTLIRSSHPFVILSPEGDVLSLPIFVQPWDRAQCPHTGSIRWMVNLTPLLPNLVYVSDSLQPCGILQAKMLEWVAISFSRKKILIIYLVHPDYLFSPLPSSQTPKSFHEGIKSYTFTQLFVVLCLWFQVLWTRYCKIH